MKDVSFELMPGDSLGLIGRNGAGKSTLLKMMNGLTKPDAGRIVLNGRVQALINLGAGFNPALSGIENIYNAASLLGLSGREIRGIVEAVVDFSELQEVIDSPVYTYSSGMKARLGFGVAVHLQPDILLIDEVLAVGDHAFRNKCYTRMQELKKEGVTIVLVSHARQAILQMCEKALWLHRGEVRAFGAADTAMKAYHEYLDDLEAQRTRVRNATRAETSRKENGTTMADLDDEGPVRDTLYGPIYENLPHVEGLDVALEVNGAPSDAIRIHDDVVLRYQFRLRHTALDLAVNFPLYREDGLHISTISTMNGALLKDRHDGVVSCEIRIPDFDLNPGRYVLVMCIHDGKSYLHRDIAKHIVVTGGEKFTWGIKDFDYAYIVHPPQV